ncbi:interferon alpha/beta receptor 1 [Lissotriton helveticus]
MERAPCCRSQVVLAAALLLLDSSWRAAECDASGLQNLERPQNVQIYIEDPQFTVKWDWFSKSSTDDSYVLFSAYYQPVKGTNATWQELSGCQNVIVTKCDFSTELDYLETYKVRVQAKRGSATSRWSKIVKFVPWLIAQIGPPTAVHLDSDSDLIDINISAPGSLKRPIFDPADFMYKLVIWRNDSNEEATFLDICSRYYIDGLEQNATYCLKVSAIVIDHEQGLFSPVHCIQTTQKVLKSQPKNVRANAVNTDFVVQWDWEYSNDNNVSFTVEYIEERCLKYNQNEATWTAVLHCEDIVANECRVSSAFDFYGEYSIRIRASNGTGPPVWSKKKKFKPGKDSVIGPPLNVMVNLSGSILEITMSPPGVSEKQPMTKFYNLSYKVLLWKNSSELEKTTKSGPEPFFTISDLEPLTLYCLKVQAVTEENKTCLFSAIECITTAPGESSFWKMLAAFVASAIAVVCIVPALFFLSRYLKQWISYVFFPTCTLPSNIKECLEDHHMNNAFPGYTEEPKETCCEVEIINPEEGAKTGHGLENKHSKQSSRDSGNYSNEDETAAFI